MARYILWIFPLFFALELYVLVLVAAQVGALATIGLVLLSTAAGLFLLRLYGVSLAVKLQQSLMQGALPGGSLFDGLCLMAAGWLFLLPGFVSDFIALLLLLPIVRQGMLALLSGYLKDRGSAGPTVHTQTGYMDEDGRMVWKETTTLSDDEQESGPQRPGSTVIIDCDAEDVTKRDKKG